MSEYAVPTCLALAVLVVLGRRTVPGHGLTWAGSYEAFAHIWVGGALVVALYERSWWLGGVWAGAAVYELAMFLTRKGRGALT